MWVRVVKTEINKYLRVKTMKEKYMSDIPYKQLIIMILNAIIDKTSPVYHWYWTATDANPPDFLLNKIKADHNNDNNNSNSNNNNSNNGVTSNSNTGNIRSSHNSSKEGKFNDEHLLLISTMPSLKYSILKKFGDVSIQNFEKPASFSLEGSVMFQLFFIRLQEL